MGYTRISDTPTENQEAPQPGKHRWWLHITLFVVTCVSCFQAGLMWAGSSNIEVASWNALLYTGLLMLFLLSHEFGHYIAARYHKVDATLPFTLPFPLISPFGTLGAVIAIRSPIRSRKALFDIGVSGPLAGFVVSFFILLIGFLTLPSIETLYGIHPEYRSFGGALPEYGITFGDNLLFGLMAKLFANPNGFLPPMNEVYHYPFLCVGWFGLFVTSLNLLPLGQLDGGHILYAMFGRKQGVIARIVFYILLVFGLGAALELLHQLLQLESPDGIVITIQNILLPVLDWMKQHASWYLNSWIGWLLWVLLSRFVFGVEHQPVENDEPIGTKRMAIGWIAIVVFVLSLSPNAIYEVPGMPNGSQPEKKVVVEATTNRLPDHAR